MSEPKYDFSVIGQPLPKIDAWGKVTGETRYADDLVLPRLAFGKLLRSAHAHARIVSIDTTRARALPGVLAVITGHDLPRVKFGILLTAKALLDENPKPARQEVKEALAGNLCRCTGYTKILDAVELAALRMVGAQR